MGSPTRALAAVPTSGREPTCRVGASAGLTLTEAQPASASRMAIDTAAADASSFMSRPLSLCPDRISNDGYGQHAMVNRKRGVEGKRVEERVKMGGGGI